MLIILSVGLFMMSCTTQEFESPTFTYAYRITLKNVGNADYTYHTSCYFFYEKNGKLVKKKVLSLADSELIHPDDPKRILAQSKGNVKGVSMDFLILNPSPSHVKFSLILGTIDDSSFEKVKVLKQRVGTGPFVLRRGQYY